MRFFLILIVVLGLHSCGCGMAGENIADSCESYFDDELHRKVYYKVDEMASYGDGYAMFLEDFYRNFSCPVGVVCSGKVIIEFIVDENGNVVMKRIRNKEVSSYSDIEIEALRVFSILSNWTPGKCKGKSVATLAYLPIYIN